MATPDPSRPLAGKVAVVTGASSTGIGGAIARRLASLGSSLLLASTESLDDRTAIETECARLAGSLGTTTCRTYDFTSADSPEQMIADTLDHYGRIDILVNNAAIRNRRPIGEFSAADFDVMVAVNLRAPFLASQAAVPHMRRLGGGRIIHIASQMGLVTLPDLSLYSMTKAGLISLGRSMAVELAQHGISVNTVSPGPVLSGHVEAWLKDRPADSSALLTNIPLGRFGTPDDVAEVVQFLATCDTNFLQGHNLVVDGGYVAT